MYDWKGYFAAVKEPRKTIERCMWAKKWDITLWPVVVIMIFVTVIEALTLHYIGPSGSILDIVKAAALWFLELSILARLKFKADEIINLNLSIAHHEVYMAKLKYLRG